LIIEGEGLVVKYSLYVSVIGLFMFILVSSVVSADEPLSVILWWLGILGALAALLLFLKYVYIPVHKRLEQSKSWNLLLALDAALIIAFYALMLWMASVTDGDERAIRMIIYTIIFFFMLVIALIDNFKMRRSRSK